MDEPVPALVSRIRSILWIGSTYFFTWLDGRLTEEEAETKDGKPAQVWMVQVAFLCVESRRLPSCYRRDCIGSDGKPHLHG